VAKEVHKLPSVRKVVYAQCSLAQIVPMVFPMRVRNHNPDEIYELMQTVCKHMKWIAERWRSSSRMTEHNRKLADSIFKKGNCDRVQDHGSSWRSSFEPQRRSIKYLLVDTKQREAQKGSQLVKHTENYSAATN
jgi:hypothetical protein